MSHGLERSAGAERAALDLMEELRARPATRAGGMFGVLVAEDRAGAPVTLRARSGRASGGQEDAGWVPPVPQVDIGALEARTFERIEAAQARLVELGQRPAHVEVRRVEAEYERRLKALNAEAQRARAGGAGFDPSPRRRALRAQRLAALAPWRERHEVLVREVAELKARRRRLSSELHAAIRDSYRLPNRAGVSAPLEDSFEGPSPGGAGDCCAPKLLVAATRRGLRPTGMAEFWWGPDSPDGSRVSGRFYGPCEQRCQPILGHLLCDGGLTEIHGDEHLLVVDKPPGLASVPGPDRATYDSVQSRLRLRAPDARPAHRLDVDTSGLLLIALDAGALGQLSAAFRSGRVRKRYVALLEGPPDTSEAPAGLIEMRVGPDPADPRRQRPDPSGRLARTRYRLLDGSRVEFEPLTGRTHQLRVAAREALGRPIVGDRLYGRPGTAGPRLMLHAAGLTLDHPVTGAPLRLDSPVPF